MVVTENPVPESGKTQHTQKTTLIEDASSHSLTTTHDLHDKQSRIRYLRERLSFPKGYEVVGFFTIALALWGVANTAEGQENHFDSTILKQLSGLPTIPTDNEAPLTIVNEFPDMLRSQAQVEPAEAPSQPDDFRMIFEMIENLLKNPAALEPENLDTDDRFYEGRWWDPPDPEDFDGNDSDSNGGTDDNPETPTPVPEGDALAPTPVPTIEVTVAVDGLRGRTEPNSSKKDNIVEIFAIYDIVPVLCKSPDGNWLCFERFNPETDENELAWAFAPSFRISASDLAELTVVPVNATYDEAMAILTPENESQFPSDGSNTDDTPIALVLGGGMPGEDELARARANITGGSGVGDDKAEAGNDITGRDSDVTGEDEKVEQDTEGGSDDIVANFDIGPKEYLPGMKSKEIPRHVIEEGVPLNQSAPFYRGVVYEGNTMTSLTDTQWQVGEIQPITFGEWEITDDNELLVMTYKREEDDNLLQIVVSFGDMSWDILVGQQFRSYKGKGSDWGDKITFLQKLESLTQNGEPIQFSMWYFFRAPSSLPNGCVDLCQWLFEETQSQQFKINAFRDSKGEDYTLDHIAAYALYDELLYSK